MTPKEKAKHINNNNMAEIKLEEMKDEQMYCLVAPDGSPQVMSLADDYIMCMTIISILEQKGVIKPFAELSRIGYQILPVKLSLIQTGTAEDAFQSAKTKYSKPNF